MEKEESDDVNVISCIISIGLFIILIVLFRNEIFNFIKWIFPV